MLIDTETVIFTGYQSRPRNLSILCHERHIEIGTRPGTLVKWHSALSLVWKEKNCKKKKTNKQNELNTWEEIYKTTYSRYQSTYKSPFAFDKIQSRIILLLLGMKIRRKPNSDNTEKPAKRLILTMILKLLNYRTWSVQMFYWCSAELVGN